MKKVKVEEMDQRKVKKMVKSAEGSAGLLHKITKPTVQILEKEEEDARLLDRCEAKKKEWRKRWQCDEEIQNMQNEPWKNDDLKECEEALPRLKRRRLRKRHPDCTKQKQEWDATDSIQKFLWTRQKKREEKL